MWIYEKKLQFPIDIKSKDLRLAKTLIAQYGGPDCKQRLIMFFAEKNLYSMNYRGFLYLEETRRIQFLQVWSEDIHRNSYLIYYQITMNYARLFCIFSMFFYYFFET